MIDRENGHVVHLHSHASASLTPIVDRLEWVLALFTALHAGELLSAFPDGDLPKEHFRLALNLLKFAEIEIADLCALLRS